MGWNPTQTLSNVVQDPMENITGAAKATGGSISNAYHTSVVDPAKDVGAAIQTGADKIGDGWEQIKDLFNPTANQGIIANQAGMLGGNAQPMQVGVPGSGGFGGGGMPANAQQLGAMSPQFKQAQLALLTQLNGQAMGTGPSVAANQLKSGQEAALAATIAQANSGRGGAQPGMARAAMQTGAEMQGRMAQEAATARLQEQMQAAGLLGQVAGQGRDQEIKIATENANLKQAHDDLAAQYAAMGLDAQKANQEADLKLKELIQSGAISQQQLQMAALGGDRDFLGNMAGGIGGGIAGMASIFGGGEKAA